MARKSKKNINKQESTKFIYFIAIFLFALIFISKLNNQPHNPPDRNSYTSSSQVKLSALGDMLPHDTLVQQAQQEDGGYDFLSLISKDLQNQFNQADIKFCNQESPSAPDLKAQGYPTFNAPPEFAHDLQKLGCNLISTANNHSADQSTAGIQGTLELWDSIQNVKVSGTYRTQQESHKLQIIEKNGIKLGFTAFNEYNNINSPNQEISVAMLANYQLLEQQIKDLKNNSDVVIVSVHWGREDSHEPSALQKEYATKISDLGADIIIGTGPHVWQPYEVLQNSEGQKTHVWYSIGNGINTQTKADQLFSGIASLTIQKKDGIVSISTPQVTPTYMHYVWQNGIGLNQSQLLGRTKLKWMLASEAEGYISERNDFKTTAKEQKAKLKSYLKNDSVEIL